MNRDMNITVVDPIVNKEEVLKETGLKTLSSIPSNLKFTIIILALCHDEFKSIDTNKLLEFSTKGTLIFDLTNKLIGEEIIKL